MWLSGSIPQTLTLPQRVSEPNQPTRSIRAMFGMRASSAEICG